MQDIFKLEQDGIDEAGNVIGHLKTSGLRPRCYERIVRSGAKIPLDLFRPLPGDSVMANPAANKVHNPERQAA